MTFIRLVLGCMSIVACHYAGATTCADYMSQMQLLHSQVQVVIGEAVKNGQNLSGPECRFRSDPWSVRTAKHEAWCTSQSAATIDARLSAMATELSTCKTFLQPRNQSVRTHNTLPAEPHMDVAPKVTINFDGLPLGPVSNTAFATPGVLLSATPSVPAVYAAEPAMRLPAGRRSVLLIGGGRETTLNVGFEAPVRSFAVTRIGTANGASTPTWRMDAFDAAGRLQSSTGEEHGLPAAPQTFVVSGNAIAYVVLTTDNRFGEGTWATWNSLPIAAFEYSR